MSEDSILVGFYDASMGAGASNQLNAIGKTGYRSRPLSNFSKTELADVDIILTQNPDNSSLGKLPNFKNNITKAVNKGSVFILHDRHVEPAVENFLPGFGSTEGIYRYGYGVDCFGNIIFKIWQFS